MRYAMAAYEEREDPALRIVISRGLDLDLLPPSEIMVCAAAMLVLLQARVGKRVELVYCKEGPHAQRARVRDHHYYSAREPAKW
jgi:hypothetical protein